MTSSNDPDEQHRDEQHRERRNDPGHRSRGAPPGQVPNEDEVAREFPAADQRPLEEQTDLIDDDGTDIRQYTGEPVETEHGTVVPQQMTVGAERVVGGGEFPNDERPRADADTEADPATPSSEDDPDADTTGDRNRG